MAFKDLMSKALRLGRRPKAPQRDTQAYPNFLIQTQRGEKRPVYKPTPRNLRYFSRTPYARRAINAIKNPVAMLDWEVVPIPGVELNSELERQIAVAKVSLERPNTDDSFRTMTEQVVEDILCGAGAIEIQLAGDRAWLFPTDGLSIQVYPGWTGAPDEARYCQATGLNSYSGTGTNWIQLRNDELSYLKPNPSTATPFGLGPLEVAFMSISRQLGVAEFAGNVTTNAKPSIMLDMGEGATPETIAAFRSYWTNDIEGQGKMPIVGTKGGKTHRLYPEGDAGLYLLYQEFIIREIAAAFDLSPQNLNVERDVKVGNGQTSESRDWDQAIKPMADLYAAHLTRDVIQGRLGFSQLMLRFPALEAEDEGPLSENYERDYQHNAATPNEYRKRKGLPPTASPYGDMLKVEMEMAVAAAGGVKQVLDPALNKLAPAKPAPQAKE